MPTVREFEQAFADDPTHQQAFLSLRKAYGEKQRFDKLVTLYESRAQATTSDEEAADLYHQAAELRIDQLADAENAETVLQYALQRLPGHPKASDKLRSLYRDQERMGDYLTMLEVTAGQVVESGQPDRRAGLNAELGQLDHRYIQPLEQTAQGQRAEITPEALRIVVSARKIHRALGNWSQVMRMYDLEVSATADDKRKADLLLACAKLLAEKANDLPNAAIRVGESVRLRAGDDRALELQAWIFAQPGWQEPNGKARAATLYHQLARRRHEAGDVEGAIGLLRRALTAVPGHAESSDALEKILLFAGRFKELDRYYRERTTEAADRAGKVVWVQKRAKLAEDHLKDDGDVLRVYEELAALEPPGSASNQQLAKLYSERQNFAKLAELRERQLAVISEVPARLPLLRELATLYRDRLGDADQAAVYLHAILQLDPADDDALKAYGDHFRKRGDFNALVDLLEFAADSAAAAGPSTAHEPKISQWLQEVAAVAERNLGDLDRAIGAWRKLEDLGFNVDQARETQKRLLLKEKRWEGLAELLAREAQSAPDVGKRIEVLRRLARHYQDKLAANEKAVETYRLILSLDPTDAAAFRAVVDVFEAEQNWPALAELLRSQVPVVPQAEQVTLLRRLAGLYAEQLARPQDATWAAEQILARVPGDRDAYFRLEDNLEAAGDLPRLAQVLVEHAATVSQSDKAVLVARAARITQDDLEQPLAAAPLWEQVLELSPYDPASLFSLAKIYTELERAADLARILELQIAQASDDPGTQVVALRRLAKVRIELLADDEGALDAWERLLALVPEDAEALQAACDLYRERGDFARLVDALGRQVAVLADPAAAVALCLERAHVLEVRLSRPLEAIEVLEQVVDGLDPHNVTAFEHLRRLAEAQEDWPKVVAVAERQMLLQENHADKVQTAMEISVIHRDRLGDPDKAITSYERVLGMDAAHRPALQALAELYAMAGEAERLVATDEKLLSLTDAPHERRRLMFNIADALESSLAAPRKAFAWVAKAHAESEDEHTWARLQALAETHSLWDDLIRVHENERARATTPSEQVEVAQKIANIYETRLGAGGRAFTVLRDALVAEPDGATLLPELERLALAEKHWQALLDVYMRVARGRPSLSARADLLFRRATVFEERLGDPSAAMDEWLRRFGLDPSDAKAREEIMRLSQRTGRWEDALKVYGQLFARAVDPEHKVDLAKQAAAIVEERVKDRVRAFRAYLNAFRLAPDDQEIVGHLWRLAGLIGFFDADAKRAANLVPELVVEAVGRQSNPDATMHLVVTDASLSGAFAEAIVEDVTDTLTLDDAEEVREPGDLKTAPPPPPPKHMAPPPSPGAPSVFGRQAFESAWAEFANAYTVLPALDNASRRRNLLKIAEIWEKGAQDLPKAFEALARAFALDPFDAQVRQELERLAEERQAWDELCRIYLGAIDSSMPADDAVSIHHDVAAFRERLGQRDLAEERYLAIVNLQPLDRKALDQLEDIYRSQARWDALAPLLERRRHEAPLPAPLRRAKAVELASLYERHLDRPYEAIDTLERYLSEFDDEPAGPDDTERMAELRLVLDNLARLYGRVNLWQKAAGATQRSLDLEADGTARKRLALALANIYEKELAQPAKAADTFKALLDERPGDPEALAALERLCEALGRYEELASVLEQRIAVTTGPERLALVKRRSRVLEERLRNPDAAAANLRGLGTEMLDDDEIAGALLRNLRRAGLGHEALRLLSQRVERLTENKAEPARVLQLHLDSARLRLDDLDDAAGAKHSLQAALKLSPGHTETLGLLAKVHLKNGDFLAFAEARAQEAESLGAVPEAAVAFVEAGRVYRDQLENKATAQTMFAKALQLSPDNVDAVRALASLHEEMGQAEAAQGTLRAFLELDVPPRERALVLTDLARSVWASASDVVLAVALLESAIDLAPDHQPALVALADIHYQEQQWELAERRLLQALRRLKPDTEGGEVLYERLAEVYERLGRADDGYRQLQEAEKRDPARLSLRIALGRNRFLARKWREAASHLENVDAHPEAKSRASEVAAALAMAGESCAKLKQNDKARGLLERALQQLPTEPRALRLLASLEMESGQLDEAAAHLRELGVDAATAAENAALLEHLGDLYTKANNKDGARASYEAAVSLIDAPTQSQLGLFDKALALQNAAGAVAQAAQTAARLIGLEADPKQRAKRRREAAATLLAHNQLPKAAELLAACLDDDATDEVALASLVEVQDKLGEPQACLFRLERILPTLPPPVDKSQARARRVMLWHRLGKLRLPTSTEGARLAFEEVLKIDPGHVASRDALSQLYSSDVDADVTLTNHRALAAADPTRSDSLRLVARVFEQQGKLDWARCTLEVLNVLGLASPQDQAFLAAHPTRTLKPDEPYGGVIDEPLRKSCLVPEEGATLAEVFSTMWEGGLEFDGTTLESLGVSPDEKISPLSEQDLAKVFGQVCKALDNQKPGLFVAWDPKVVHMQIAVSRPPAVVVPSALAADGAPLEVRFWLGRTLELTRPENILAATVAPRAFSHLFGSVLKAFHPRHARRRGNDSAADATARLRKALPYRVAKRLGELFTQMADEPFSSARWRDVVEGVGNRAGLVCCGDLATAARAVLAPALEKPAAQITADELRTFATKHGPLRELLRFAQTEQHFTLRQRLGLSSSK